MSTSINCLLSIPNKTQLQNCQYTSAISIIHSDFIITSQTHWRFRNYGVRHDDRVETPMPVELHRIGYLL